MGDAPPPVINTRFIDDVHPSAPPAAAGRARN